MTTRFLLAILSLAIVAGCGDAGTKRRQASGSVAGTGLAGADTTASSSTPGTATTGQPAVGQTAAGPSTPPANGAGAMPNPLQSPSPTAGLPGVNVPLPGQTPPGQSQPAQPGTVTEKAQAGVSGRGNYEPGLITTPVSAYFQVQEQLAFQQVTHAMKLYEAANGEKPKTEDEFMTKIIKANSIKLPPLPEGSKYKYDPKSGELLVEHPQ